jgi:CRP-like cAMP-binding protein
VLGAVCALLGYSGSFPRDAVIGRNNCRAAAVGGLHAGAVASMAASGMRSKLKATTSSVTFTLQFTKEMEVAAVIIQGCFRRMVAMKRMAALRRVKAKHMKLARLNGKGWTKRDSMANMLQSAFLSKLARRVVQRAAQFLTKALHHTLCSDEVLRVLHMKIRTNEDLSVLAHHFENIKFMQALDGRLQRLQACRYLHAKTVSCGTTLFETDDVGDKLYIILRGRVECCISGQVKSAEVKLQCGPGDSFGEQSLRGENEGRRDATVTAMEDCMLAQMERADFLRLTGQLTSEVLSILAQPYIDGRRTLMQLKLCQNLFHATHFFQALHFALLQIRCCDVMSLVQVSPGNRVYQQGKTGDSFYIVIKGTLQTYVKQPGENQGYGTYEKDILEGEAFGEAALTGKGNAARRRAETVVAGEEKVFLAKLLRNDFVDITNKIEKQVYKVLHTPTRQRTQEQVELLFNFLRNEEFFKHLQLDGMRQQCCKAMMMQRVGAGEILFSQGDRGETFHIIIRGAVRVVIDGSTVRELSAGASFGEIALLAETEAERVRTASILAMDDCLIATLTRKDFLKVHDRQELTYWINKFWVLTTTKIDPEHHDSVHWKGYKKIHLLIAKTVKKNYNSKKDGHIARKDWVEDLNRHNKGGHSLNHSQFADSLFELVDVWCEGCTSMLLYVEFLRTVFLNTTVVLHDRAHKNAKSGKTKDKPHHFQSYTMKKVNQVKCRQDQLDELKAIHIAHHQKDEEMLQMERQTSIHDVGHVEEDLEKEEEETEPEPETEIDFPSSSSSESEGELSSTSEEDEENEEEAPTSPAIDGSGGDVNAARSQKLREKMLGKSASRVSMHAFMEGRDDMGAPRGPQTQQVQEVEEFERDPYNDRNATESSAEFAVGRWEGTQELGYLGTDVEQTKNKGTGSPLVWKQAGQKKHQRYQGLGGGTRNANGAQKGEKHWHQAGTQEEAYRGLGLSEKQTHKPEHHQWKAGGRAGNQGFSSLNQAIGGNQDLDVTMAGNGYPREGVAKDMPAWRAGGRVKHPLPSRFELAPQTPPSGIEGSNMQTQTQAKSGGVGKRRGRKTKRVRGASTRDSRPQTRGDPARYESSDGRRWSRAIRDTSDAVGPGTGKPNTDPIPRHVRPEVTPSQQQKIDRQKAKQRRKDRRLAKRDMKRMRAEMQEEMNAEIAQAAEAGTLGVDFDLDLSVLPQAKLDEWLHLRSQLRNSGLAGRKRGIAWFQKLIRELNIVPPAGRTEGPLAAFTAVPQDASDMFEEIDDFNAARQSTYKWKKSLRTYGPAAADTPMLAESQRELGVSGEAALIDPVSQTLKMVAQTWSSGEWDPPGSVDRSLVVALQDRSRSTGPAVSGMQLTRAEQDAAKGYRWPPREGSPTLPAI